MKILQDFSARKISFFAFLIFTPFILINSLSADTTVRTLTQAIPAEKAEWVFAEFPVANIELKGTEGDSVHVNLKVRCEKESSEGCFRAAKEIELDIQPTSDGIDIGIKGWPKFGFNGISIDVYVEIPRRLALDAKVGVGEMDVSGLENDIDVDMGVGQVNIEMKESLVRSVNLDAGVGEATLRVGDDTIEGSGLIGHGLYWREGSGRAALQIDCGVGSIDVYLKKDP